MKLLRSLLKLKTKKPHFISLAVALAALFVAFQSPSARAQDNAALAAAGRCMAANTAKESIEIGQILLQADNVTLDTSQEIVIAEGNVEIAYYACVLLADRIEYDRKQDIIRAEGEVALMEPGGNIIFAERLELSSGLEQGAIETFSALLNGDTRIAAVRAERQSNGLTHLDRVVYSPCYICQETNKEPLWQLKAVRVTHDENAKIIRYHDAVIEVKGVPIAYLPYFAHADPSVKRRSGFLVPSLGSSTDLGNHIEIPYFWAIDPHQDITFSPLITGSAGTAWKGQYRRKTKRGEYTLDGSFAYAEPNSIAPNTTNELETRSHLFGSGRFRLTDVWSYGFNTQLTSDDTYLERYEISELDRLTSEVFAEGYAGRNYAHISGFYFQGLRETDNPDTTPVVLPQADIVWYPERRLLGGTTRLHANILGLTRSEGGNSHRLSLSGHWQREKIVRGGHVLSSFAQARGDVYWTNDINPNDNPMLPDNSSLTGRALPMAGVEWRWPQARAGRNIYQIIEPIVQLVWSPYGGNPIDIPNEDSTSFEFDDTNLFSANKSPGLDLVESGPRANIGFRYGLYGPSGQEIELLLGQNFRLQEDNVFDQTTGLGNQQSDYVGRIRFAPTSAFNIVHRFRINREDLSFSRNEFIANIGRDGYWGRISYVALSEELSESGLEERKEFLAETRMKIYGNWHFEGQARRDLANKTMVSSGAAIVFSNECAEVAFQYKRRFTRDREIEPSSTFNIKIRLKTLGNSTTP